MGQDAVEVDAVALVEGVSAAGDFHIDGPFEDVVHLFPRVGVEVAVRGAPWVDHDPEELDPPVEIRREQLELRASSFGAQYQVCAALGDGDAVRIILEEERDGDVVVGS
jgi:hypothetical protein